MSKNFRQNKEKIQKIWTKQSKCPKILDKIKKKSKKFGQNKGNVQKFFVISIYKKIWIKIRKNIKIMLGCYTMRTPKFQKLDVFNKIKVRVVVCYKKLKYKISVCGLATMSCKNFGQNKGNVQKIWTN